MSEEAIHPAFRDNRTFLTTFQPVPNTEKPRVSGPSEEGLAGWVGVPPAARRLTPLQPPLRAQEYFAGQGVSTLQVLLFLGLPSSSVSFNHEFEAR